MSLGELQINLDNRNNQNDLNLFTLQDESNLTNLLLSGNIKETLSLIEKLTKDNICISEAAVMRLNTRLISILFKIATIKGIEYDTENRGDLILMQDILSHSPSEVYDIIQNLLNEFSKHIKDNNRVDIGAITHYVQENFAKDLFLDKIAEIFNTSPKYLSRKFKETMKMNFSEYLAEVRMQHAQTLLLETEKSTIEIMEECGFNNRTTFIRTFKNYTGYTPSQWRKNVLNTVS